MIYFKKIKITGVANKTTYDEGLESSKENPKRLLSIICQVALYNGSDVEGWWEREKIFAIQDYLIDTRNECAANKSARSFNRLNEIEVGYDLPVGSTFKAALKCLGAGNDFFGAYRYEIKT